MLWLLKLGFSFFVFENCIARNLMKAQNLADDKIKQFVHDSP